ncbi:hypothetical protein OG735_33950 [Streptomyces sp. NBC_01210]|uniref:hypothetical protein n=1 Tax=Streptomyces sp. NBC_01210 TaxID=2903774 RepID=UPI002E0DD0AE|nr:hypothetical protein OG735_33950 [Streptomyces sp. NBC_01210]
MAGRSPDVPGTRPMSGSPSAVLHASATVGGALPLERCERLVELVAGGRAPGAVPVHGVSARHAA